MNVTASVVKAVFPYIAGCRCGIDRHPVLDFPKDLREIGIEESCQETDVFSLFSDSFFVFI